jgi:hypothetical protein
MTTPKMTPAQRDELSNWLRGVDDRTLEQLKADLREMGDGVSPRSLAHQGPGRGLDPKFDEGYQ